MRSATVNGSEMRRRRERKTLTIGRVATLCSQHLGRPVHITTINKIEKDQRQPSAELYEAICKALGCEWDDLLMATDADSSATRSAGAA